MNKNWTNEINFYKHYPLLKRKAYKIISSKINNNSLSPMLDFGCGDGKLLEFIKPNIITDLYDINKQVLNLAKIKIKNQTSNIFTKQENIHKNKYKAIVFSLVMMCISNKLELDTIIKNFYNYLKKDGIVIILITHPCFRNEKFSYFNTEFSQKRYNYFNEGMPFKVFIKDSENNVSLNDYHWSLSFTLNLFIKNNFKLVEFNELKDVENNKNYSPYICITVKK